MSTKLEQRVAALERQLEQLQREHALPNGREWLDDLSGVFANDRVFDNAMKLGRKYRKSTRNPSGQKPGR